MLGFKQLISLIHSFGRLLGLLMLGIALASAPACATDATADKKTIALNDGPKRLTAHESAAAVKVVVFGAVPDDRRGSAEVNHWSDVPPATRNYADARDAIVHHIDNLVPALAEHAHPQETLQGVITAVDQRNDRISIRLASDTIGDFKVQDGIIFNAVRNGDRVEITVEDIGGVKTIVGLKKQ